MWDPDAFRDMCADLGTSPDEVERAAHLMPNRFDSLEVRGHDPFCYELWRISEVLGASMDEVFDRCFESVG